MQVLARIQARIQAWTETIRNLVQGTHQEATTDKLVWRAPRQAIRDMVRLAQTSWPRQVGPDSGTG